MSSYGHRIQDLCDYEAFRLTWKVDRKYPDSRLRFPQVKSRDTDLKGAQRFAKKWGIPMPERKKPLPPPEGKKRPRS